MTPSDNGCLTALVFNGAISTQADNKRNGAGAVSRGRKPAAQPAAADHVPKKPDFHQLSGARTIAICSASTRKTTP